eukprot:s146_g19.t1
MKLPVRYDVVNSLELFEDADLSFKKEVAAHGKRYVCTIGEVVVDGRQPNDCIYIVEYGVCSLQNELRQELEQVSSGSLFAVSDTVFGISRTPGTVAQVVSPFAAIMEIRQKDCVRAEGEIDLTDALQRHYDQRRPPPFQEEILPAATSLQHLVATTEIFGKDLCAGAQLRSYLPGQTLCIQAKQDKGQMFLVRGGALFVEKDGRRMHETNTCIGDLVILGAEHQRPCTVRAQTFVFTLEIPKAVFVQAIDKHPDSRRALENYALQTITGRNDDQGGGVQWPMQQAAPQRLSYLLNLYAGVKLYDPAESDWKRLAEESAVLVVQGTAQVVNEEGEVVEVLGVGDTFNEQILLGIPGGRVVSGRRFHMREGPCELQFVSLAVWEKVVSDFPQEQDMIFRSIRQTLANKAAIKNHGTAMSSPEMVRMSPLLRYLSQETIQDVNQLRKYGLLDLARHFEPVVVKPYAEIVTKGRLDSAMYILLSGSAYMEAGKRNREYSAGQVFGEAEVLGVSKAYNNTVYANNLCILAALTSADLWHVVQDLVPLALVPAKLEDHPQDALLLEPLCNVEAEEAENGETSQSSRLDDRIFRLPMGLASWIHKTSESDSFFGPGEAIFKYGEECLYGVSDMYVLLAGEVDIETDLGVVQARLLPSEVFGEGSMGAQTQRNASARAWSNAYVHCARIHGASIANALKKFPQETEWFEDLQESRRETNADFMARRNKWLSQEVIPALAKVSLLSIHDELFLADMAAPLIEKQWAAGEVIVQKAAETDAMIVLLEGEARIEAQNGTCIDYYDAGSSFGEMAMLGLMKTNPATVRAATACRTLAVRQSALRRSLDLPTRTPSERQDEPISALKHRGDDDDLCAKAIALQAELKPLKPGESWTLEEGGCFCVVTEGRAILELASDNERLRRLGGDETPAVPVMPLAQGSLVLEEPKKMGKSHSGFMTWVTLREVDEPKAPVGRIKMGQDHPLLNTILLHHRLPGAQGKGAFLAPPPPPSTPWPGYGMAGPNMAPPMMYAPAQSQMMPQMPNVGLPVPTQQPHLQQSVAMPTAPILAQPPAPPVVTSANAVVLDAETKEFVELARARQSELPEDMRKKVQQISKREGAKATKNFHSAVRIQGLARAELEEALQARANLISSWRTFIAEAVKTWQDHTSLFQAQEVELQDRIQQAQKRFAEAKTQVEETKEEAGKVTAIEVHDTDDEELLQEKTSATSSTVKITDSLKYLTSSLQQLHEQAMTIDSEEKATKRPRTSSPRIDDLDMAEGTDGNSGKPAHASF